MATSATVYLGSGTKYLCDVSLSISSSSSGSNATVTATVYWSNVHQSGGYSWVQSSGACVSFDGGGSWKSLVGNSGGTTKYGYGGITSGSVSNSWTISRWNYSSYTVSVLIRPSVDLKLYGSNTTLSDSVAISHISAVTGGSASVTDLTKNQVKISGTAATSGANNPATSVLQYSYNNSSWTNCTSNPQTLTLDSSKTVYARMACSGPHTTEYYKTASRYITYYSLPTGPSTFNLTCNNATKTRRVVKKPITLSWSGASGGTNAPITKYRLRLFKKSSDSTFSTVDIGGGVCNPNDYIKDFEVASGTNSYSFTFTPVDYGLKPKDTIYAHVHAYSTNAADEGLNANPGAGWSLATTSDTWTFDNAGVMKVYQDGQWKEGVVKVCQNDGTWKEAEVVKVYQSDGTWKESQ